MKLTRLFACLLLLGATVFAQGCWFAAGAATGAAATEAIEEDDED